MFCVNSVVVRPSRFAPNRENSLDAHLLAIGRKPRLQALGKFGFDEGVKFLLVHLQSSSNGSVPTAAPA
jgi:hypothetical protein